MMRKLPLAAMAAILAAVCAAIPRAPACGIAPQHGQSVEIAEESALIVWDEATKTEHFIRKAKFQSTSTEFGFLVPTPTQPELAESDDAIFTQLASMTAPKHETRIVKMPRQKPSKHEDGEKLAMSAAHAPGGAGAGPRGVEVLEHTEVGGMEAVVLKFHREAGDDPAAGAKELADWLKTRGYDFDPNIAAWLKPYIANNWVMTAFRIAKSVQVSTNPIPENANRKVIQEMQGKPIRMTFKTDRAFYPYREPVVAEKPKAEPKEPWNHVQVRRFLRVYFLASERYTGTLGTGATQWVGAAAYSDKLNEDQAKQAAATAKLPAAPSGTVWLTEFEDSSSPRQGTDEVYFGPAADKSALHRPVIYHDMIEYFDAPEPETETPYLVKLVAVIGGILFVGILGGLVFLIFRQR